MDSHLNSNRISGSLLHNCLCFHRSRCLYSGGSDAQGSIGQPSPLKRLQHLNSDLVFLFFFLSLRQDRDGHPGIWAYSSVSAVLASIETWGSTSPRSNRSIWTNGLRNRSRSALNQKKERKQNTMMRNYEILKLFFVSIFKSQNQQHQNNSDPLETHLGYCYMNNVLFMCVCVCAFSSHQSVQEMGNAKAKRLYEAFLPKCFQRPESDQSAEIFIRDKYDKKKYMDKVIDIQMLRVSPRAWRVSGERRLSATTFSMFGFYLFFFCRRKRAVTTYPRNRWCLRR